MNDLNSGHRDKSHPLAEVFVSNRHLLVLTILVIMVGGYSAIKGLPRLEDPVISNRNAQILTLLPGAPADRVEALISEPLEQELREITAIKHIESVSRAGVSVVTVELADAINEETNDAVFSEIRDKVGEAAVRFPPEATAPSFDDKRNAVAFTLITALHWEDGRAGDHAILRRLGENLGDRLRGVSGTELVRLYGDIPEEILVELNVDQLASMNISPIEVHQALRDADVKIPSGAVRGKNSDMLIEVSGEFESVQRIREVPLRYSDSGHALVRIADVARVRRGIMDPPMSLGVHEGDGAVYVAARVMPDQRVDLWAARAMLELEDFRKRAGGMIAVTPVFSQDEYTSSRLGDLAGNLFLGAVVVFLVVLLTMGWRASIIISTALPLVASSTLFVVAMQGGKLHQMSIFGMIIALGLLIDNAIVVTDEVRRGLRAGAGPLDAVSAAVHHLFLPLLSSTLTTVLSFLPILLLPGPAGDFVSSISSSVIIALCGSFLIAMTVIAALAGLFGKSRTHSILPGWLRDGLFWKPGGTDANRFLLACIRHRRVCVGLSLVLPVTGFLLATTLGSQFFPRTDRNMFEVEIRLPTDASLERTKQAAERIDSLIRTEPAVTGIDWMVGESFPTVYYNLIMNQDGARNYAHGIIATTDFKAVTDMIDRLQDKADKEHPDLQVLFSKFAQGPPADADVEFRITGPDIQVLQELGEQVRLKLAEHPDILHTLTTIPRGEPKLKLSVRESEARMMGLSLRDIAAQIDSLFEGSVSGTVMEGIEELPVRIRMAAPERDEFADLSNVNLVLPQATDGGWTPLSSVASVDLVPEQGGITRRDGQRVNKIHGFVRSGTLAVDITDEVMQLLDQSGFKVPVGYELKVGGETENRDEAVGNLLLYLPVIIVVTVAVLILTFRSVRIALILLMAAPMSAGFGLIATWAMQFPVSFNTIIGSLGLMGLAFNSSIVVLASIMKDPEAAGGDPEAIAKAVNATTRHLVSTTMTTIGSFLPLLLFIGGQFWPPLAIVLAGGVGGSTLLALTFTPAMYTILKTRDHSSPAPAA